MNLTFVWEVILKSCDFVYICMKRNSFLFLLFNLFFVLDCFSNEKTIYDSPHTKINNQLKFEQCKYFISFSHIFSDTLFMPKNCELVFNGGSLSGPIVLNNTLLSGSVDLKGSSIRGSVRNELFDASWICNMDGKTDDARHINEIIEVCGKVLFPKGCYRLISSYTVPDKIDKKLHRSIQSHIGVSRSDVSLIGEEGTEFLTEEPIGTICFFSRPKMIEHSIRNILIEGITFTVKNDGVAFHEFMHTIKLIGVNNFTVTNCTFNDFWGDAICLSHYGDDKSTGERTRNQNVKITNNSIRGGDSHNNRNGISVISGKNVLIKDNIIRNTTRKDMPGGIDIEPNNSAYTIENIRIENNTFANIEGTVGAIGLVLLKDNAPAKKIVINNNVINHCSCGITIVIRTNDTSKGLEITNNVVDIHTRPYKFVGSGSSRDWIIKNNSFKRMKIQKIPGNIKVSGMAVKGNK